MHNINLAEEFNCNPLLLLFPLPYSKSKARRRIRGHQGKLSGRRNCTGGRCEWPEIKGKRKEGKGKADKVSTINFS